ncbi:unnamed protein product, partial [Allacma fusca]
PLLNNEVDQRLLQHGWTLAEFH